MCMPTWGRTPRAQLFAVVAACSLRGGLREACPVGYGERRVSRLPRAPPNSSRRNGLLAQPNGFEGFAAVEQLLQLSRLALLINRRERVPAAVHGDSAVGAVAGEVDPGERVVPIDPDFEWFDTEVGIGVEPALMLLSDRVDSPDTSRAPDPHER